MEKLLNTQILRYLQSHSLIFQHQSGFLPNHSTVTQLCFLVQKWQMAIDKGEHVQAAFLDLSKAYCSVLTLCTSFWQSLILCTSLWQAILYWHASIFLYVCIQPFSLK